MTNTTLSCTMVLISEIRPKRSYVMSILNVEHLTHGFGDRAIFADVSFRLLKGEHIGLVGAKRRRKIHFFKYCYRKTDAG